MKLYAATSSFDGSKPAFEQPKLKALGSSNMLFQFEPLAGYGARSLLLCVFLPFLLPLLLSLTAGALALAWSIVFKICKAEYDITITPESLPPKEDEGRVTTPDGVDIRYCTTCIPARDGSLPSAEESKVVLFFNPLGHKGFAPWGTACATIAQLWGPGTMLICWDYRGFFESDGPKRPRAVDVRNHAEDARVVLKEVVGNKPADVIIGHSMGVQVALEFILLYPEDVGSVILMNGTYGHALQTAFQPLLRLPYMGGIISYGIQWLLRRGHEWFLERIRCFAEPFMGLIFQTLTLLFGSRALAKLYGKEGPLKT